MTVIDKVASAAVEYRISLNGAEIDLSLLELCFSDEKCRVSRRALDSGGTEWILSAVPLLVLPERYSYRAVPGRRRSVNAQFDDNLTEVRARADRLIACMDGAARLLRPNFRPIGVAGIYEYGLDGTWRGTSVSGSNGARSYSFPTQKSGLPDLVRRWAECGIEDSRVSDALQIYGSGPITWSSLYLIYEIIKDDCHGRFEGIASNRGLEDFCRSANNNRKFSEGSRHAKQIKNVRASAREMLSLQEAHLIVRQMLNAWLGDKIGYWMR